MIASHCINDESTSINVEASFPLIITQESLSQMTGTERRKYSNVSTGSFLYKREQFRDIVQILVDFRPESIGVLPSIELENESEAKNDFMSKLYSSFSMDKFEEQAVKVWFFTFLYRFMTVSLPSKRSKAMGSSPTLSRDANNGFCMFIMDLISIAISKEPQGPISCHAFYLLQFVRQSNHLSFILMDRLNLTGKPLKGFILSQNLLNSTKSHNLSIPWLYVDR